MNLSAGNLSNMSMLGKRLLNPTVATKHEQQKQAAVSAGFQRQDLEWRSLPL